MSRGRVEVTHRPHKPFTWVRIPPPLPCRSGRKGQIKAIILKEKLRIKNNSKIISLTREEAMRLCRPGAGADTCICLVMGQDGFECLYHNMNEGRNLLGETLEERWKKGLTVAKRYGCDEVRELSIPLKNAERKP